jgi:hypothetical protein
MIPSNAAFQALHAIVNGGGAKKAPPASVEELKPAVAEEPKTVPIEEPAEETDERTIVKTTKGFAATSEKR